MASFTDFVTVSPFFLNGKVPFEMPAQRLNPGNPQESNAALISGFIGLNQLFVPEKMQSTAQVIPTNSSVMGPKMLGQWYYSHKMFSGQPPDPPRAPAKVQSSQPTGQKPQSAGILLFTHEEHNSQVSDANETLCVAMVKTPEGRWGFPKGKRSKKETPVQNALRELTEETGVKLNRGHLVEPKAVFFDERSSRKRKGLCIRYFMAYVAPDWKKEKNYHSFQYDTRELSESKWVKVKDALSLAPHEFKDSRKQILKTALQKIEQTRIASTLENQMSFN